MMVRRPASPNRDRLIRTARRIAPLLGDVVFVGGQLVELLVTDPAATRPRPTDDVDVVVQVTTRSAYRRLQEQLRRLGFEPDMRKGAPVCRTLTRDGLVLDVMPLDETILGFSNRWYPLVLQTAIPIALMDDLVIRASDAPAFLATKWEAFRHRGTEDPLMSHDLEDIVALVAGRPRIVAEVAALPPDPRQFVSACTRDFLNGAWAADIVAGSLPDARILPGIIDVVVDRMQKVADV